MKISYSWLKEYITLDKTAQEVAAILTDIGLEVESLEVAEAIEGGLKGVYTAEVLTCVPHPNSDHLHITTVNVGQQAPLQIVCGAPNVAAGQKVLLATVGTVLSFTGGEKVKIKKGKIRGEESLGMICAQDELGIGTSHEGIMVLPEDTPVGIPAKEYLGLQDDAVFEIGLTPNRVDAASHLGVARDLYAYCQCHGIPAQWHKPAPAPVTGTPSGIAVTVEVQHPEAAPRYSGVTLHNVHVAPSPQWLQNRLTAVGVRPINNVVDITNYVLFETGQPLHAFDRAKIEGNHINVRLAAAGEPFVTLDGVSRTLHREDLMICHASHPMCMAGIFGGLDSGVTEATTSLFLESAYFNPEYIRKSSKRHGIKTEASFRYERGADPQITLYALARAVELMQTLCGAEVQGEVIDIYPQPLVPARVEVDYQRLFSLLGKNIGSRSVDTIVEALEMKILERTPEGITVEVPLYRVDVQRPCDVAEEVLRIYGYNRIELPTRVTSCVTPTPKPDPETVIHTLSNRLAAQGFREIMCNSLTKSSYYEPLTTYPERSLVRILNPLSSDLNALRQTLLWGGLESVAYNLNRQQYDLRLFEFGNVYTYKAEADTEENAAQGQSLRAYKEAPRLALWACGARAPRNWHTPATPFDFYSFRAYVEQLLHSYGISLSPLRFQPAPHDLFEEGITYLLGSHELVQMGTVKRACCEAVGITQTVFYAEFCWDRLFKVLQGHKIQYAELPRFPEVHRDLALVVDAEVPYAQLHDIAFKTEKRVLKKVQLVDVYKGDKLPQHKKQYALSFVLQDQEKTLTATYVEQIMDRLVAAFAKEAGAVLR